MRILIAPDKFKGTITAREAADIIATALSRHSCVTAPMADGGEGTAYALCNGKPGWVKHPDYYVNPATKTAVIDSSAIIGTPSPDLLKASSEPLGVKVREILQGGCQKVYIGVGGTMTCDAGVGFLMGLGPTQYASYRANIVGLCDVTVPLIPEIADPTLEQMQSMPSALMFAKQKGALSVDYPVLLRRLKNAQEQYGACGPSPYDGAGGGLGFAIASAIGAECLPGAEFVLASHHIDWQGIDLVITGEGRLDAQTSHCKVVATVAKEAAARGIPCIALCGKVTAPAPHGCKAIDCSQYLPDSPLTPEVAKQRLSLAAAAL